MMLTDRAKRGTSLAFAALLLTGAALTAMQRTGPPAVTRSNHLVGQEVPIVAYGTFSSNAEPGTRSGEAFREDLNRLRQGGFRPMLLSDYVHRRMRLGPKEKPVVITFDGSDPSQFRLLPKGEIDPECAVGIWSDFAFEHPEFPLRATFFLDPGRLFGARAVADQKLALLRKWGCEFGLRPSGNRSLAESSAAHRALARDLARLRERGCEVKLLALPYGQFPADRECLKQFDAVVLPGAGPAPAPDQPRQLLALPRFQADESELGLTKWLDRAAPEP